MDVTWCTKLPALSAVFQLLPSDLDDINDLLLSVNYQQGCERNSNGEWTFHAMMVRGPGGGLVDDEWVLFQPEMATITRVDPQGLEDAGFQPVAGQTAMYTTQLP